MDFKNRIIELENKFSDDDFLYVSGSNEVLLTAPHTMEQVLETGIKLSEPYTKAIALYVAGELGINAFVKVRDTFIDANKDEYEKFKTEQRRIINNKGILLSLDIHGASQDRDFDIELGTVNNLSADYSTINELKETFQEQGLNVVINDPFKGGAVTKNVYGFTDAEAIQIEINRKLRDIENIDGLKKVCDALINFIKQYIETTKRRG